MPRSDRTITRDDILDRVDYESIRSEKREEHLLRKRLRRLAVGPDATVIFESWDTMWLQVQEMLRIEKGGEEQLADELAAYNSMVPDGRELTCTLLFEIDDRVRRGDLLGRLGGVEHCVFIQIAGERIVAVPEGDVDRSTTAGKASAVHFLHFRFGDAQVALWRGGVGHDVTDGAVLGIDHPAYRHIVPIAPDMRRELARDFT